MPYRRTCRKWLPIRKGYDQPLEAALRAASSRKWLPIRKGYDARAFSIAVIFPPSKMASDSEGLRRVYNSFITQAGQDLSKMASDSEGLRHYYVFFHIFLLVCCRKWLPIRKGYDSRKFLQSPENFIVVENGFRFGRVTTAPDLYGDCCNLRKSKMASDSEGLRQVSHVGLFVIPLSRKWLPIRKGYDR